MAINLKQKGKTTMNHTFEAIGEKLDNEIETAKGVYEIMLLICAGTNGFERNGITFQTVNSALSLISKVFNYHVQSLDSLANELVDFQNDLKLKS